MPLAFWPASQQPFSTAKEWLLAIWVLSGFVVAGAGGLLKRKLPSKALAAIAIWIIALSLSAGTGHEASIQELIRDLLPCAGFLLLLWAGMRPRPIILALVCSGTLVALIAILQFTRLDPFLLLNLTGSLQGSSRMRVFSTLGNPNFVAAFLTTILPLTVCCVGNEKKAYPKTWRILQATAGLLQAGAIVATGSRAPVLGFVAAGIWILFRKAPFRMWFALAGLAICALMILFSPARPLEKTIAGRLYVWKVVGAHVREIPLAGYGPGAFALRFAEWETNYLQANPGNADRSFAGLQDHAHNDYLEFLVDYGFIGLSAFFVVIGLSPLFRRGLRSLLETGSSASIIALLAVAMVDFPLHRPLELYLFWTQLALLWILRNLVSV
jgi:putative inorganic carbon (hco3(-)) transporter